MPLPAALVSRLSHKAKMAKLKSARGRQWLFPEALLLRNCRLPLELTLAVVNVWSYSRTGNGKAIAVVQSSQWLPVSVMPGMITEPVEDTTLYCPPVGQAVGVAVAVFSTAAGIAASGSRAPARSPKTVRPANTNAATAITA